MTDGLHERVTENATEALIAVATGANGRPGGGDDDGRRPRRGRVRIQPVGRHGEHDETATYTVELMNRPSGNVVISATSGATATATVSPGTLTFGASDWNTPMEFTVTGKGAHSTSISHAVSATAADATNYPTVSCPYSPDSSMWLLPASTEITSPVQATGVIMIDSCQVGQCGEVPVAPIETKSDRPSSHKPD